MKKSTKIIISVAVAVVIIAAIVTVGIISSKHNDAQNESSSTASTTVPNTGVIVTENQSWFSWSDYVNSLDIPTSSTEVSQTDPSVSVTGETESKPNFTYIYVWPSDTTNNNQPGTTAPVTQKPHDYSNEYSYSIDNSSKTVILTKYIGTETNVRIPDEINGCKVVKIADECFAASKVKSIWVSANISEIGVAAFKNCTALETVWFLGRGETTLGRSAFSGCTSLRSIYLSLGTTEIGAYCFENCTSLKEISISKNVQKFGDMPFRGIEETLTIKCSSGSVAYQTAQKYGIKVHQLT